MPSILYLATRKTQMQDVLKYFSIIRTAAKRHSGSGWKSYDVQFRLRMAASPGGMSFGHIDQELWLLFIGPSNVANNTNSQKKMF